jgi:predicted transcriptional regulator
MQLSSHSKGSYSEDTNHLFIKVHMNRITGAMLMRSPDLQPRDVAILLVLMTEMDTKTGRINLTASALARKCELSQSNVALSLSRLKKKLLVINRQDKNYGGYYMRINPDLASVNGPRDRAMHAKQFKNEWLESLTDELNGDRVRALAQWESLIDQGDGSKFAEEEEKAAAEQNELEGLVKDADPRLQELLVGRKVFKPSPDRIYHQKIKQATEQGLRTVQ